MPLPRPEFLSLCMSTPPQERRRTAELARRAEGRMPGVKRKEPKGNGTPMARPPGILPCGCAGGWRTADFPPPARRAIGAPGKAARSRRAEARAPHPSPPLHAGEGDDNQQVREAPLLPLLLARTMRACSSGAPGAAVRRGRQGRAASETGDGLAFSRGQEPARKARRRLTHLPSMDGRQAPTGVSFSLGDFSFGQAKEKSLGHRQVVETRSVACPNADDQTTGGAPTNGRTKPL